MKSSARLDNQQKKARMTRAFFLLRRLPGGNAGDLVPRNAPCVGPVDCRDVLRQATFRALNDLEPNPAALLQRSKTIHLDGREVRENVFSPRFRLDEPESLGVVEPFDSANGHVMLPHLLNPSDEALQILRRAKNAVKNGQRDVNGRGRVAACRIFPDLQKRMRSQYGNG
jgi:hypothetical protein